MRYLLPVLAAIALMAVGCSAGTHPVPAQASTANAPAANTCLALASNPPSALKLSENYQERAFIVFNSNGRVANLAKDDLLLTVGNRPESIDYFEHVDDAPAAVVVLVDTSHTTANAIADERALIAALLDRLSSPDKVGLIAFSERPFVLSSFTTDRRSMKERLSMLHAFGGSALYYSLLESVQMAPRGGCLQSAVVLITDTNSASKAQIDDVATAAQQRNVRIYPVILGNSYTEPAIVTRILGNQSDQDKAQAAAKVAAQLAQATGGRDTVLPPHPDHKSIAAAVDMIARDLGNAYVIGFKANNPDVTIQVKNRPDCLVSVLNPAAEYAAGPR